MAKRKRESFVSTGKLTELALRLERKRESYGELTNVVDYLGDCIELTEEEKGLLEALQERLWDSMEEDEKNMVYINNRL